MFRDLTAIVFKIGTYCDLDCIYCFQQHDIKTINQRFEIYKDTVKFLSHPLITFADKLEVKITGGEPSLYAKDIYKAYREFKKLERYKQTNTYFTSIFNGTKIEDMISLMDDGVLDSYGCKLSWDGIYSSSKSRLTKIAKYDDEYFRNVVKTLGKSKYGKDVLVRIALTPNTIDDIVDSFIFALDCGCDKIEYYYLTDCEEYRTVEFRDKFRKVLDQLIELKIKRNFNWANWETLEFASLLNPEEDRLRAINCRHLGKMLYIEQNGKIAPCGFFSNDALFKGCNLYIGDVYNGFYKEILSDFISQYKEAPMCNETQCANLHCFECPAVNLFRNGHMQEKLYQTCFMRSLERKCFEDNKNKVVLNLDQSKKAYSYTNDWDIEYSLPKLPYAKEEIK
jgi:hypothetical protein